MKDFIKFFTIFFCIIAITGFIEGGLHKYTLTDCKVISIHDDIVTIEDNTDYLMMYNFCGRGFNIGDKLTVTFHDHYTDTRIDDEVIGVEKI